MDDADRSPPSAASDIEPQERARLLGRSGTLTIEKTDTGTRVRLPQQPGHAVCSVVVLES